MITKNSSKTTQGFLLALSILILSPLLAQSATVAEQLTGQPIIRAKAAEVIPSGVLKYLKAKDQTQARVWIFFTDKGVFDQGQFDQVASTVSINERSLKRRAKVSQDEVLFADLPVLNEYVEQVVALGGQLRRESRWLNAASYDMSFQLMQQISELPFVASVRPVAGYVKDYTINDDLKQPADATAQSLEESQTLEEFQASEEINYGPSFNQLNQIGVVAAHQKGYQGQGVTLAILDTGYRKSHEAFAQAYAEGRVLAEYDFIFDDGNVANEIIDASSQWNHGTSVWGVAGGELDGQLYGPAYKANFLLAKTEDIRSETPVEEDNWVAAMEWADSHGADVITTSLGYSDWYSYSDFNGETATITIAANTAVGLGIVVCNSMGNSGPADGTLTAPADAFEIIACGAVDVLGNIAGFSSRGPTFDGRTKPEVCARGVSDYASTASTDATYGPRNGTSFSAPLVAGAVCLLVQARPLYTPQMIRQALMETADNALTPNNTYGWGIMNIEAALAWGVSFSTDQTTGGAPLTVQFTDQSTLGPTNWLWDFGDGTQSTDQNPLHVFDTAGIFSVGLTVSTPYGAISTSLENLVIVSADTLWFGSDSAYAGQTMLCPVSMSNDLPLDVIKIAFEADTLPVHLNLDSIVRGERTLGFEGMWVSSFGTIPNAWAVRLTADQGGGTPPLPPGSGEILKLYFSSNVWADDLQASAVDSTLSAPEESFFLSNSVNINPVIFGGLLRTRNIVRGDLDHDGKRNLTDITMMIAYVYQNGIDPIALPAADVVVDQRINLADITLLIGFVYQNGDDPDL